MGTGMTPRVAPHLRGAAAPQSPKPPSEGLVGGGSPPQDLFGFCQKAFLKGTQNQIKAIPTSSSVDFQRGLPLGWEIGSRFLVFSTDCQCDLWVTWHPPSRNRNSDNQPLRPWPPKSRAHRLQEKNLLAQLGVLQLRVPHRRHRPRRRRHLLLPAPWTMTRLTPRRPCRRTR